MNTLLLKFDERFEGCIIGGAIGDAWGSQELEVGGHWSLVERAGGYAAGIRADNRIKEVIK